MPLHSMTKEEMKAAKERAAKKLQNDIKEFTSTAKQTYVAMFKRIPVKYQRPWLMAYLGRANKTQAIKAKCQECCAFENLSHEIGECQARGCPLWHHRPYKKKEQQNVSD